MPIREITRRTGLSRNTVRKYLASGVIEPRYPRRKTPSKLDDYELTLTSWLFREARRHRKQRDVNKRFTAMVSHYLFEAEFCNPAAGWEKGQVEMNVLDSRRRIWQSAPAFESLSELNRWLKRRCLDLWQETAHPEDKRRTISDYWQAEREHLMEAPAAFDGFVEYNKRVSSTCLISYDYNRYSVPASFANRPVSLRVYADRLVIVAEASIVAVHERVFSRDHSVNGKTIYDWRHYLSVVQRKPGALRNGAPFHELPDSFRQLQRKLLKRPGGDREMVDVLALVLLHDEALVEQAVADALKIDRPSKQHVINCLSRITDKPRPEPTQPPAALKLVTEPVADTHRYDRLRRHKQ